MDLGQQGQRPGDPRPRHAPDGPRAFQGTLGAEQGERPEEAEEGVERPEVGMREDAGHRRQREARDHPGRAAIAPPRGEHDQADQDREGRGGGQPRRDDVEPDRVGAAEQERPRRARPGSRPAPAASAPGGDARRCRRRPSRRPSRSKNPHPRARRVATYVRPGRTSSGSSIVRPGPSSVRTTASQATAPTAIASRPTVQNRCGPAVWGMRGRGLRRGGTGPGSAAVERVRLCTMSARGASRRLGEIGGRIPETGASPSRTPVVAGARLGLVGRSRFGGARGDQGSSAFFWEIRRRTRSASRAPSKGFLKASLKPSE